jgi:hypothetical protein
MTGLPSFVLLILPWSTFSFTRSCYSSNLHRNSIFFPLHDINNRIADQFGVPEVYSDNEWHPRDPASTTPQLLAAMWHQITQAGGMAKGVSYQVNIEWIISLISL